MRTPARQTHLDRFYWQHGPCCAGCDRWASLNAVAGECTKSPPVAESERMAMLDMQSSSLAIGAGHVLTPREHVCGSFKDDFDWSSLPRVYRQSVGAPS